MPGAPGLPRERTALAWQRTGVAGTVIAGTTLVAAAHLAGPAVVVAAAVASAGCAVAVGVAARQARRADSPWERLLAVAAVPVLLAVVGVLLAAVG